MARIARVWISTCLLVAALAACKSDRDKATSEEMPPSSTVPAQTSRGEPAAPPAQGQPAQPAKPAAMADPSDAEIAAIASTGNQIEIDQAKLALTKTKNPEVEKLAQMMIKDHSKANDDAKALLEKLGLAPQENEATRQAKTEAASTTERLNAMTGADFDKAYVANLVDAHQKKLDKLDSTMIPSADNAELKALLTSMRPVVEQHLEHARMVEKGLTGGTGGMDAPKAGTETKTKDAPPKGAEKKGTPGGGY